MIAKEIKNIEIHDEEATKVHLEEEMAEQGPNLVPQNPGEAWNPEAWDLREGKT